MVSSDKCGKSPSYIMHVYILCVAILGLSSTGQAASLMGFPVAVPNLNTASFYTVLLASVAALVGSIYLIIMCLDFCQKHSGFKDFDNEAYTDESAPRVPVPSSEFTMYPPIDNTPDSISPIVFEPLPDITLHHNPHQPVRNAFRMRPRLVQEGHDRSESTDSLDKITHNDNVQQKLKLQSMLSNTRHHLPRNQLQYIKELGNGWFGKVLQGEGHSILPGHKKTKVVIQMLKEDSDRQDQLAFLEEVTPFRVADHENVVKLLGQCVDTEPFLNVLELCPFGDLKTYLRSHRVAMDSFNEKGLPLKFACDMAAGLQALHQEGFIHRDFAIRNCLLASDLTVKIGDYGISEETFREDYYLDRHGDAVPIRWLAPECLLITNEDVFISRITKQSNIWTYGVALWEVMTFGSMPYSDLTNSHVLRLVVMEKSVKLRKPDVSLNNLERLYELLQLCWSEPEDRPSLRELRIMLLHLLSRKDNLDTTTFDQKWTQLMPRRSPRVIRAGPYPMAEVFNGLQTITGWQTSGPAIRNMSPSVMTGVDSESVLEELNGSQLGLAGSNDDMSVGPASPVNEMSLQAEFSAANVAAANDSDDDDIFYSKRNTNIYGEDDVMSPIPNESYSETEQYDAMKSQIQTMPDIVKNGVSAPARVINDFMTSTPKENELNSNKSEVFTTAIDVGTTAEKSQATETYHTAQSFSFQGSVDHSLSEDLEGESYMGRKKFADMLQTVAMSISVDNDSVYDEDSLSDASPMPNNLTEGDIFLNVTSKNNLEGELKPIDKIDLDDFVLDSGENTPRNTSTAPAMNFEPSSIGNKGSTGTLDELVLSSEPTVIDHVDVSHGFINDRSNPDKPESDLENDSKSED